MVRYLLNREGIDPNASDRNWLSPLMVAARSLSVELVCAIVDEAIYLDVDAVDREGRTAIDYAREEFESERDFVQGDRLASLTYRYEKVISLIRNRKNIHGIRRVNPKRKCKDTNRKL